MKPRCLQSHADSALYQWSDQLNAMSNFPLDIDGKELLVHLRDIYRELLLNSIVGCKFQHNDWDHEAVIAACDPESGRIMVESRGVERLEWLSSGFVLCSDNMRAALKLALNAGEDTTRSKATRVSPADDDRTASGVLAVLAAQIRNAHAIGVPEKSRRKAVLELDENFRWQPLIEQICRIWMAKSDEPVLGDVLIKLVRVLRHTGRIEEALENLLILDGNLELFKLDELEILFNQRAALFLDYFDLSGNRKMLQFAESSCDQADASTYGEVVRFFRQDGG